MSKAFAGWMAVVKAAQASKEERILKKLCEECASFFRVSILTLLLLSHVSAFVVQDESAL